MRNFPLRKTCTSIEYNASQNLKLPPPFSCICNAINSQSSKIPPETHKNSNSFTLPRTVSFTFQSSESLKNVFIQNCFRTPSSILHDAFLWWEARRRKSKKKLISIEGILFDLHWRPLAFRAQEGKNGKTNTKQWRIIDGFSSYLSSSPRIPPSCTLSAFHCSLYFCLYFFFTGIVELFLFFSVFLFSFRGWGCMLMVFVFIDYKPCSTNVNESKKEKHKVLFSGGKK